MKLDATRLYLVVRTLHDHAGTLYRPGEIIHTPTGRARSFATANRAMGYRDLHLGVHFPVDARHGSEITLAAVATTVAVVTPSATAPIPPAAQRDIWASVAVTLWADDPLDAQDEWNETKAQAMRVAIAQLGLARIVETAVQEAIATNPDLARFNLAATIVLD